MARVAWVDSFRNAHTFVQARPYAVENNGYSASAGVAVPGGGGFPCAILWGDQSDVDVRCVLVGTPGANNVGLALRSADSTNFVRCVWDSSNATNLFLQKRIAGTFTTIGSASVDKTAGKTLRVILKGSTYSVYFDGALVITATDAVHATNRAQRVGMTANQTTAAQDNLVVLLPDGRRLRNDRRSTLRNRRRR